MSGFGYTAGAAVGGVFLSFFNWDQETDDRWIGRYLWCFQFRDIRTNREQYGFWTGWHHSRGISGDATVPLYPLGQDTSDGGIYESVSVPDSGAARGYFIVGTVKDGAGNVLAACQLDVFLTGSDTWVCTVFTDSNGIYSAPTPYVGASHYIVANYGPNTLVGASVNTLTPGSNPWG